MEKQQEYILRNEIEQFVLNKINNSLDEYYEKYKDEIGFLLYYPLYYFEYDLLNEQQKLIEEHIENPSKLMNYILPNYYKEKMKNLHAVSWFIKEMKIRKYKKIKRFTLDVHFLKNFRKNYDQITKMYKDYISSMGLRKRRGVSGFKLIELDDNNYELAERVIFDNMLKEQIYFYGMHDDNFEDEINDCMEIDKYIKQNYNLLETMMFRKEKYNSMLKRVNELHDNIDNEFLNLCIDRVSIDINKLGAILNLKL